MLSGPQYQNLRTGKVNRGKFRGQDVAVRKRRTVPTVILKESEVKIIEGYLHHLKLVKAKKAPGTHSNA
jgi:hypothetical protein